MNRRGVLVVPAEVGWIPKHDATDLTSRFLRKHNRRGTLVTPAEAGWILKHDATDLTSRSLRKHNRRGVLVVPADLEWIIQRSATDLTSRSLRAADATNASLRLVGEGNRDSPRTCRQTRRNVIFAVIIANLDAVIGNPLFSSLQLNRIR
jgi:hypothetical protein